MGRREETLLGFQLINKINLANEAIYQMSCHLRVKTPYTLEDLQVFDVGQAEPSEGSEPSMRSATVSDVETLNATLCYVVDLEAKERIGQFLTRFDDDDFVRRSLQHFRVSKAVLDRDLAETSLHSDNVRNVHALVKELNGFREHGNLLSLYREQVDLYVVPDVHIGYEYRDLNTLQDQLNVLAFELTGLCSYTGMDIYWPVEERVKRASGRLETIDLFLRGQGTIPGSASFLTVLEYVRRHLSDCVTTDDFDALGAYVESQVPQLPLLRRWWKYG